MSDLPEHAASAPSLTQAEARARAELLDVSSYEVHLDLAGDDQHFTSRTVVRLTSRGGSTFLDCKPRELRSATLDGAALDVGLLQRGRLPLDLPAGEHEVVVEAVMAFRHDGEGLHRSTDPADGRDYVYGMSFMDAAPSVFACFDQPDLKAPYTLHVRAPQEWTVIGNGAATQVAPGEWELATTPPLSTYFVTLVAGPYHVLRAEHDGIPLGFSARASLAAQLERDLPELLAITRACFDEMHRLFGIRYPFGDYHQAFVPEFNAGAMENPGCVTFRDDLVPAGRLTRGDAILRATTIAHEMAHQWFGNIVTPRWWDDLWLNESFAEYLGNRVAAQVTDYDDAWVHTAYSRRQWGLVADARPTTHPVAGNGAPDALSALQSFDGISYTKGSTVLKQLATRLGDEVFFGGVVDHLERHRFGNATMHDLLASWERAGAADLGDFVDGWLLRAGPDVLTHDRETSALVLTPPAGQEDATPVRRHTFHAATHDGERWSLTPVETEGTGRTPLAVSDRPVVLDARHETWAVAVPDEVSVAGLVHHLADVEDPELRAAAWNNLRSGVHEAAVDPAAVVEVAVASPPVEDVADTGRHTVPWLLGHVVPFAPAGSLARLHGAFARELEAAEPGSERQLAALRAAIRSAEDEAALRAWLAPGGLPDGVEADLALRWRLLERLAAIGAVEAAELDEALAAEPTTAASVAHARASASRPDPAAKEQAWRRFTGEVAASNYELEASGVGLWRGDPEVSRPYVERYLAELPATAAVRSGWVLGVATEAFYPLALLPHLPDDGAALVQGTEELLATDGALTPPMRKRVLDLHDECVRRRLLAARYPRG